MLYKIKTSMVVEAFKLIKADSVSHVDEIYAWLDKHMKSGDDWEGDADCVFIRCEDYVTDDGMHGQYLRVPQGDYLVAWAPGCVLPLKAEVFENLMEPWS